jgi:hypothetical protein
MRQRIPRFDAEQQQRQVSVERQTGGHADGRQTL